MDLYSKFAIVLCSYKKELGQNFNILDELGVSLIAYGMHSPSHYIYSPCFYILSILTI